MKVLLLLNGPEGWQTGIEDGFSYLKETGVINKLEWCYYDSKTLSEMSNVAKAFQPDLIVVFHIGKFPITQEFITQLKNLESKPILAYDEGDMYGTWAKPITASMKMIMKQADVVSLRGLGAIYEQVKEYNDRIIYTPHHADIARFDKKPFILNERKNKLVLIGNKIKPRIGSSIRRMPGAKGREGFVQAMGAAFSNEFVLHGNGWNGFVGNQGPVGFQKQLDVYRDSWITVAYEHYPKISYYFSNRLPIALMAGSLYVCHYHKGYGNIFKGCDFIFFFKTYAEAVDLVNFIHSLSDKDLLARSKRAREFSLKYYHPNVVWENFYNNVMEKVNYAGIE